MSLLLFEKINILKFSLIHNMFNLDRYTPHKQKFSMIFKSGNGS